MSRNMVDEIEFTCSSTNHIYCVLNDLVNKVNSTKEWPVDKKKLRGFGPLGNYADQAAAACRSSANLRNLKYMY
jgi:hypothetical protein